MEQFAGYGGTLEQAVDAAAEEAAKSWTPAGPDDMLSIQVDSMGILYGGFAGHTGTRVAKVSLTKSAAAAKGAGKAELSLKFEVLPDTVTANLMPPIRQPQPHKIGMVLTVTNTGKADYRGQSPDTGVVRFTVLNGRMVIWRWPEIVGDVVTPVTIRPSESRPFTATWEMPDAVTLVNADLHAVARFVPSGESAMRQIHVKAAF